MPYRYCAGLLWLALLCCWFMVGCEGRRVNVTLSGAEWNWTANGTIPAEWSASGESRVSLKNSSGECPVGRYCPRGSRVPIPCRAGTYSDLARQSTPCAVSCSLNFYCPYAGQRLPCPANTYSARGTTSQLGCRCNPGYACVYKKVMSVKVGLGVPYRVMAGSGGDALKLALVQAVAETAGVPLGSVKIDRVLPGTVVGGVGGAGGARRLLGAKNADSSVLLSLSVEGGGEGLDSLREKLRQRREFRRVDNRVHWKRVETLQVRPAPAKAWEFFGWRAK